MIKTIKEKLYPYKKLTVSLFKYPKLQWKNSDYNAYWHHRHLTAATPLNSFQKKRADLVLKYIRPGSSVIDIGSGNGRILMYLNQYKKLKDMIGVDISEDALDMARENGIKAYNMNISDVEELKKLPPADYIMMFEILEHINNSEEILEWALGSGRGVFFSVPNTGFISHRLRLALGRFPLQWRLRPSEHVRFWTARDMKWWLEELGIKNYKLDLYEGIPLLNKVWPSLFGQGLFVFIPVDSKYEN